MTRTPIALAASLFILPALGAGFSPGQLAAPAPPVVAPPHSQGAPSGRIPLSAPISTYQAGYYYLTEDVTGQIVFGGDGTILDLNGHTVTGTIIASSCEVTVRDGFVKGYISAFESRGLRLDHVSLTEREEDPHGGVVRAFYVDDVQIADSSIHALVGPAVWIQAGGSISIQRSHVERFFKPGYPLGGLAILVNGTSTAGIIENNTFTGLFSMDVWIRGRGIIVRGNSFSHVNSPNGDTGIRIEPPQGHVPGEGEGHLIENNAFTGWGTAIQVDATGNVIRGNTAMGQFITFTVGGNIYRDNAALVLDTWSNNINGGGNFP